MSRLLLGALCGIVFGAIAVALRSALLKVQEQSCPSTMPSIGKPAVLSAAFINRFAVGFLIGATHLPWPGWIAGLVIGLLLSLPDAIITKTYAPVLGVGTVGGAILGLVIERFGL